MVKLREEFHRPEDHSIEPEVWFNHVAQTRTAEEITILQNAYQLSLISGEEVPTFSGISAVQYGLAIADILDNLHMDIESLAAAVIYPSLQYTELTLEDVSEHLGGHIAKLVGGVSKMDAIRTLYSNSSQRTHTPTQLDNIRKMLLSMVEDVRVVLIKLAERTVLMRSITLLGKTQQQLIARETQDIFAPLANRLGIAQIKWELEDFAFRYLESDTYKKIAKSVAQKRGDREKYIQLIITTLEDYLKKSGVHHFEITGRAKHIYSIYKKMQRKNVPFDQIYDVTAVRILVSTIEECYAALGIAHSLWEPIPVEFDDYITNPKSNGYRSLHTAVVGPENHNVEIQIRTDQMHEEAELGVAAHWIYKEGDSKRSSYDKKIAWLRQIIDWQKEVAHGDDQLEATTQQVFEDRIYVFTPTGQIIDLPQGATPLDFGYAIHTEVGHRCRGAKANDKIVPLTYQLKMGDRVEILTAKEASPSRDWMNPNLGYLKSSRAKARIHHWFTKQDHDKNAHSGRELLEKELKKLHLQKFDINKLATRFNYKTVDDLYAGLGAGIIKLGQIVGHIESHIRQEKDQKEELQLPKITPRKIETNPEAIDIQGVGNLLHHIANCCKPLPGEAIIGFITQGRGVSIHRQDCNNILESHDAQKERLIEVSWGKEQGTYPVDIFIYAYDRPNLVRDITTVLSNEKVNLVALLTSTNKKEHTATITLTVEIAELAGLSMLLDHIHQLPNMITVERHKTGA